MDTDLNKSPDHEDSDDRNVPRKDEVNKKQVILSIRSIELNQLKLKYPDLNSVVENIKWGNRLANFSYNKVVDLSVEELYLS